MYGAAILGRFRSIVDKLARWVGERAKPGHAPVQPTQTFIFDRHSFGAGGTYLRTLRNPPVIAFDPAFRRSDLRSSVAGLEGSAPGTGLDLEIELVRRIAGDDVPLAGFLIYVWHCDADGAYSIFNRHDTNYLRGIVLTSETGTTHFETIFPGTYRGRAPHIHVEVYTDFSSMQAGEAPLLSERIYFPFELCKFVYTSSAVYKKSEAAFRPLHAETQNQLFGSSHIIAAMADIRGYTDRVRAFRKIVIQ